MLLGAHPSPPLFLRLCPCTCACPYFSRSDVAERACDVLKMNSRSGAEALKSMYGCLVICVQGEDGVEKLLQIAASYDNGANNANGDGAALFVATTGIQAQDLKLLLLDGERYVRTVDS